MIGYKCQQQYSRFVSFVDEAGLESKCGLETTTVGTQQAKYSHHHLLGCVYLSSSSSWWYMKVIGSHSCKHLWYCYFLWNHMGDQSLSCGSSLATAREIISPCAFLSQRHTNIWCCPQGAVNRHIMHSSVWHIESLGYNSDPRIHFIGGI